MRGWQVTIINLSIRHIVLNCARFQRGEASANFGVSSARVSNADIII